MSDSHLEFEGISASNPLGFLAVLGTLTVCSRYYSEARISWKAFSGSYRPILYGCGDDKDDFLIVLYDALKALPTTAFDIDDKLPFSADLFTQKLQEIQNNCSADNRRIADLLSAFGSEVIKEKEIFESTQFRMVRSGDSDGKGLTAYAKKIHNEVQLIDLDRTLFKTWDYRDECSSFRWDPLEDQRYALRWHDPSSQSSKKSGLHTMRGANALAIESLTLFPTIPTVKGLSTTGFIEFGRKTYFSWPIWEAQLNIECIRSIMALSEMHGDKPNKRYLQQMGISQVFRCERIAPNKYYKNFSPSYSV